MTIQKMREEMFRLIAETWEGDYAFLHIHGKDVLEDTKVPRLYYLSDCPCSIDTLLAGLPVPMKAWVTPSVLEKDAWWGRWSLLEHQSHHNTVDDTLPRPEAHAQAALAAVKWSIEQWKEKNG